MGAMALGFVFLFIVPQVSRIAIDDVVGELAPAPAWLMGPAAVTGLHPLWVAAAVIVLLTALGGFFQYLRGRWSAVASEAIARRLRNRLYAHLEELPCTWHDGAETGDLVQRCSSDVETIRVFLSGQVVELGRIVLMTIVVLPMMIAMNGRMTLISVATFPFLILSAVWFFRRVKDLFKKTDEAEGKLTSVIQENLTGIRVVRAFARQKFEQQKFGERNAEFRDHSYRLVQLLGNYYALSDLVCMNQIGLVLILGCRYLVQKELSVGELFAFLTYVSMIIWPIRHLGRVLTDAGKAMVALGRIREVLNEEPESDLDLAAGSETLPGEIEVRDLTFAYDGGPPALSGVSFTVRPGETLALLGPPGSGKSTLVALLLRLYDYQEGSIRLDGVELRDLGRRFIRSRIGVVLQEPFLYSRTVGANVRVGRGTAEDEEVHAAARSAAIHESIEEFDDGYSTLVGERGVTLSGGQRQRLAIARALLKEPDILVLDDALSAVDTGTETEILGALRSREGRRTTILIAHRISSIHRADQILVLENGKIVQGGSHRELVAEEGPYQRLWRIQGTLEAEIESGGDGHE